jgi:redox-sensitive bicupin YhaK (pirin superfamily)
VLGAEGWEKTTPFLFLSEDWFRAPKGFEEHPHRGMQTVTVVLEGAIEHRDHTGAHGILRAGDVQWMTAGLACSTARCRTVANGRTRCSSGSTCRAR